MFHSCNNLEYNIPTKLAQTLGDFACGFMFFNNYKLKTAPILPATELTISCYKKMFEGCSSLIEAPALPATNLINSCYSEMFKGCSNLSAVQANFTEFTLIDEATQTVLYPTSGWLNGVAENGIFTCFPSLDTTTRGDSYIPESWNINEQIPLTFTAAEDNTIINMAQREGLNITTMQYRLGTSGKWSKYNMGINITLQTGESVQFQNISSTYSLNENQYSRCIIKQGSINASGNVMSLLNYSNKCTPYCFSHLFYNCSDTNKDDNGNYYGNLLSVPDFPATELAEGCYYKTFEKCTKITTAPNLPATELTPYCYYGLFTDCTGLTEMPDLPALVLKSYCYSHMFYNCKGITTIKELPATELNTRCYNYMFSGCSNLNLPENYTLPALNIEQGAYYAMFQNCTSLTNTPILPATTLKYHSRICIHV